MSATCRNHDDVEATATAEMPTATKPYKDHVPLCGLCADRIEGIGFPVTREAKP